MQITLKEITVRELAEGYEDKGLEGVVGYGGNLDIRPPYQREFIYKDKQRDAVINTVTKAFPLNVMYWAVREDGNFEVIDGQQRTISVCQYVKGNFSFQQLYFHNLPDDKQAQILNYKLMVYQCTGTDSERLDWFRTINIAGEKLTEQELRNAVYAGSWVSDAKRYFSKTGCAAYQIGQDYMDGSPIRQDYLEAVIDWTSGGKIEDYMGKHQKDADAKALWSYFQNVMEWVGATFTKKRKFMKGVAWGALYNEFKDKKFNTAKIEAETAKLIADDDVTNKKGIYPYLLTHEEKHLNIRAFTDPQKQKAYEKQKGICSKCPKTKHWELEEMEADHIKPWHLDGKTSEENCQMLCKNHNRRKSGQ
ncbi:MAG: DUF262 domain-containing protein [Candidatus Omnitrophota bacterium]|nr:DUF262 domain-containing protein [Candidatus Omnitrophota bacterium]